jgi:hypothetical protein
MNRMGQAMNASKLRWRNISENILLEKKARRWAVKTGGGWNELRIVSSRGLQY